MLYNSQYIQDKEAKRRAREEQLFRETYPALYATEQRRKAKQARTAAKSVSSSKPQPKKTPVTRPATKITKPSIAPCKKAAAAATTTPAPVRSTAPAPKAATPLEIAQARISELTTKLTAAQRTIDEQHATIARLQQATEPKTTTTTLDDATDGIPSDDTGANTCG